MVKIMMIFMSCLRWSRIVVLLVSVSFVLAKPINVTASNVKKIEKLARECQAGNDKSCLKLVKIAKNDKNWHVRRAAVEHLTDEVVLAEIAKKDENQDVRCASVEKLTDQKVLAEIAKTNKNQYERNVAVKKLTDQALLAEIAKSDKEVSGAAISKLTDQAYLLDVAKNAADVEIRENATQELKDQTAIAAVVKTEPDWHAQIKALYLLDEPALLAEIAKDRLPTARDIKSGKLELLPGEIVRTEIRTGLTITISMRSTTEMNYKEDWVKKVKINPGSVEFEGKIVTDIPTLAVLILKDESQLVDVAKHAFRASVRLAAVEKLTDQALLSKIAKTDKDSDVRKAAEKRLEKLQEK